MPKAALPRLLALASLLTACGRTGPDTTPPEPVTPPPLADVSPEPDPRDEPVRASEDRTAVQQIRFDGDDPGEPTTPVRAAPKRPPMPRFQLFGTRPTDGP